MRVFVAIALSAGSVVAAGEAEAQIFLGQVSDFQNRTTQTWTSGTNPNPPTLVLNAHGPDDHALQVTATGLPRAGGRLVTFSVGGPWSGDYLSAGVSAISMDLNNIGNTELDIRFAIVGAGGSFSTSASALVPAGSGWTHFVLPIDESDWVSIGGTDITATLSSLSELRLLNNPLPAYKGVVEEGTLLVDNITAIPGPAPLALLALLGFTPRRRSSKTVRHSRFC